MIPPLPPINPIATREPDRDPVESAPSGEWLWNRKMKPTAKRSVNSLNSFPVTPELWPGLPSTAKSSWNRQDKAGVKNFPQRGTGWQSTTL
jgi:hypothetical protein